MKQSLIAILAISTVFASCKDNEVFEKEMYKNEVALISSDYHNTFKEVVQLTGEEVIGYVAASSGGTHAPTKDLIIGLEEDSAPLAKYNFAVYDNAEDLYAKLLPKGKYDIMDDKIVIKAGELTGRTMIKLRPDGLSPDSTYFIGLKATNASGVEIKPTKSTMLYQVIIENEFASQAKNSMYAMVGFANGLATAANKQLFPLTTNSVRMVAGSETFVSKVPNIEKNCLILEMDEFNNVTIKPYKDIKIVQLNNDPAYPNKFKVEETFGMRTNVFLLSYQYTIGNVTTVMKERVEMQVK
ncbi:BT_3044 domain-containing protein [Sphingobacterium spiritivorum]|uniref:BT_3044 domain-containing protein n=1 Tax=Sphingobacterium spiritivorum TaxID=258 RepID=UPI003DA21ACE